MTDLEIAKKIIKDNFVPCGIFNNRNLAGDYMNTLYRSDTLTILVCYRWYYFEVFGLPYSEFKELEQYYEELR